MKTRSILTVLSIFYIVSVLVSCADDGASSSTSNEMTAGEAQAGEAQVGVVQAGEAQADEAQASDIMAGTEEESEAITQRAYEWLLGRFDSSTQSIAQPQYFSIQLTACQVEAPNLGAKALYLEQAASDTPAAPYRQRLYVIESAGMSEAGHPMVTSSIFNLLDEDSLVGLCDRDERPTFVPADVVYREGCEVYLEWIDDHFEGSTRGNGCSSSLAGASYATSEVYMTATEIRSWDQGFDASDVQVWGAADGPYEFIRQD